VTHAMQAHATALTEAWEGWTVPAVKWALQERGLPVGSPRLPLPPASSAVQERVRRVLAAANVVNEDTAP